ncbi:tyrosine aminotransferase-like [Oppia nitens]|uniref:tyrosine aminotransferase-like n=1 Tax=Oppia nitens TaxID=1686743 RepID=UPI0023DAAE7D|nr:tyrosine aminotransferase-like [Oppia nitens]
MEMKKEVKRRLEWSVSVSEKAKLTVNPIRNVVETLKLQPNPDKQFIPLSIGDPTIFGNLNPCEETINGLIESVKSAKNNGYFAAAGCEEARNAVAEYCSVIGAQVEAKDVILTSGCSHALDLCMTVLTNPGANILVPRPGFSLYETLSALIDVEIRHYELLPERNWEIDLNDLEDKIDCKTAAIVYNNPSNPCGSVFSKKHILDFLVIAEKYFVPIIADEIYEDLVFPGNHFHPIASLTTEIPVLSCGGTTKKFLIPGWRMGWILIHDRHSRFGYEIRHGLNALAQRLVGPNSVTQGALPYILKNTPKSFFDSTIEFLHINATLAYDVLSQVPGLRPIMPSGAMYIMVSVDMIYFPEFASDLELVERLVSEESVFCLPGKCFQYPGYVRIVLSVPTDLLKEALNRIDYFCRNHFVRSNGIDGYDNGFN